EIAEMVDDYGAFLETEESADVCSVVLYTLNKHLERTLPVVFEVLTEAAFPESELLIYRRNQQQRLTVENEKVNSIARRKFNQMLFGDKHPYGHFVLSSDYDALSVEEMREYHRSAYTSSRCTILLAGKISDFTYACIDKVFGANQWGHGVYGSDDFGNMSSDPEKIQYQEKEGALQSAIRIGRRMVRRSHPDYPGLAVLNTLLGGYFGSRLMSNIREDKGYTYGIGSAMVSNREDGYFFISTEVGADVTSSALEEIYKEITLLQKDPAGEEELGMVRNFMLGSFLKSIDGPFSLIDRYKSLMLSGLDYAYYDRYLHTVSSISPEELQVLASNYFQRDSLFELVVGKKN
ncbi:MAG: M16 family metallopeptidase, partial [Bacteroidota bacterium]